MPHADALALPSEIIDKLAFYEHVNASLVALLSDDLTGLKLPYVSALSNASSLLFGSYENFAFWGPHEGRRVNWAGFYLRPSLLHTAHKDLLLLGPFHGRPACLSVSLTSKSPSRPVGVCASAFVAKQTVVVPDVEAHPGHIACDGQTQSEIVVPLVLDSGEVVGVLDVDCEGLNGFDESDRKGLEAFVGTLVRLVDWGPVI